MLTGAKKRQEALKAIELFRQHLFKKHKRLDKNITIHLKFRQLTDAWGICDAGDCGIRPREFTILINRNLKDTKDIITTVAHEMVHVWQYATGKLRDYESPVHRYENFLYDSNMSYRDMPWEIEARKLEKVLYKLWISSNK
jgi:hypothetical protein